MAFTLRRQVESRHAYMQRRKAVVVGMILALGLAGALAVLLVGCGNVSPSPNPRRTAHLRPDPLSVSDAHNINSRDFEAPPPCVLINSPSRACAGRI
jgi:hypothetical protein